MKSDIGSLFAINNTSSTTPRPPRRLSPLPLGLAVLLGLNVAATPVALAISPPNDTTVQPREEPRSAPKGSGWGSKLLGGLGKVGGVALPVIGRPIPTTLAGIPFVGGELNMPVPGAPVKMFAPVIPGVLYRAAQPTPEGFAWLHEKGIRSVVNLRGEHDYGPDVLRERGIERYLHLPVADNGTPSDEQVARFLGFMGDRENWPVLVHCNQGVGRSGTMAILARHVLQGVPVDQGFSESIAFGGGPWLQRGWIQEWAARHAQGK
jgi:protein tyrosine phosphatase (PTP) superfamily phosphohydrolase (DUF442 family)